VKIFIAILVTFAVTAALVGTLLVNSGLNFERSDGGTVVRLEKVNLGTLTESVNATGIIEPRTKVSISAKVAARVVELPFKEGDRVTKGDPNANPPIPPSLLVRLDASDLQSALRSVEARYAAQKAGIEVARRRVEAQKSDILVVEIQLRDAERDLNRQKQLLETKDVSQSVVDQAQSRFDELTQRLHSQKMQLEADNANLVVLTHNLEAAEADISRARDDLSYTTITSPIDGVITRLNAEVGELVVTGTMNNAGTVILEVADLDQMILRAKVDESLVANLKPKQKAIIRIPAFRGVVFEGIVDTVALANTEERDGSKYYKTEVLVTQTHGHRLLSGLNADTDIETHRHENVLTVPSQAVLGRNVDELPQQIRSSPEVDQTKRFTSVVYRMIDGKAVVTPVTLGPSDVTRTVITSGLSENDVVIVGPFKALEALKHDDKVKDETTVTTRPSGK
jgi:HlyD family secretion protein